MLITQSSLSGPTLVNYLRLATSTYTDSVDQHLVSDHLIFENIPVDA
jgi:hypothetical protein